MATLYTPNFNLDLYAGTDKPNLRDQYNGAMNKLDTAVKTLQDKADAAALTATNASNTVNSIRDEMNTVSQNSQATLTKVENAERLAGEAKTAAAEAKAEIAKVKATADSALALAKTNETDMAQNEADITQLQKDVQANKGTIGSLNTRVTALENNHGGGSGGEPPVAGDYAPTNHASSSTQYGIGGASKFGHVKLSDNPSTTQASSGVAATPYAVQSATESLRTELEDKIAQSTVTANAINVSWTSNGNSASSSAHVMGDSVILSVQTQRISGSSAVQIGTLPSNVRPRREHTGAGIINKSTCQWVVRTNGSIEINPMGQDAVAFANIVFVK